MWISHGNGGWHRVEGADHVTGVLYVRASRGEDGRMRITELYIDGRGEQISARALRTLPLSALDEALAADDCGRECLPAADLSRLASHYATTFGGQASHWVAESMRAQFNDSTTPQAPRGRRRQPAEPAKLRLDPPEDGRLSDAFLRQVATAYGAAVARRLPPANTLAELAGVSPRTVHRWVYTARKRDLMPPASSRGRIA